jgi:hypothetical protein
VDAVRDESQRVGVHCLHELTINNRGRMEELTSLDLQHNTLVTLPDSFSALVNLNVRVDPLFPAST